MGFELVQLPEHRQGRVAAELLSKDNAYVLKQLDIPIISRKLLRVHPDESLQLPRACRRDQVHERVSRAALRLHLDEDIREDGVRFQRGSLVSFELEYTARDTETSDRGGSTGGLPNPQGDDLTVGGELVARRRSSTRSEDSGRGNLRRGRAIPGRHCPRR